MLVVSHPKADSLRRTLAPHLDDDRVQFETGDAGLMAEFSTPHGIRWIEKSENCFAADANSA